MAKVRKTRLFLREGVEKQDYFFHGWHRPTLVLVLSMGRLYGHEQACAIRGRGGRGREPNPESSLECKQEAIHNHVY